VLVAAVSLLTGLLGLLLLRRERVFARAEPASDGGGTVLTTALLTRGSGDSAARFAGLTDELRAALAERSTPSQTGPHQTPESTPRDT
jgi:cytochrome c biogenesis protein